MERWLSGSFKIRVIFTHYNVVRQDILHLLVQISSLASSTVHGRPRYTKDIDIWLDISHDNPERVEEVLQLFGRYAGLDSLQATGITQGRALSTSVWTKSLPLNSKGSWQALASA